MIYVDAMRPCKPNKNWRHTESCHLTTDGDIAELHDFAEKLQLERSWFQDGRHPHYDLTVAKRLAAVRLGANEDRPMKTIRRKSLLYESKVSYADYALNHVLGCSHGCLYPCYAFLEKKRFGVIKDYDDWRNPRIVENALELLEKDLQRIGPENIKDVHMCFTTDPFMYDPAIKGNNHQIQDMTMAILKRLAEANVQVTTLTKWLCPPGLKDISDQNWYGITAVSLRKEFQEKYEPYAAPIDRRIEMLRWQHENGLKTWVSMEPFPTPNIEALVYGSARRLLDSISFVDRIVFGPWNYSEKVKEFCYPLGTPKKQVRDDDNRTRYEAFYEDVATGVRQFCKAESIEFYDKRGD